MEPRCALRVLPRNTGSVLVTHGSLSMYTRPDTHLTTLTTCRLNQGSFRYRLERGPYLHVVFDKVRYGIVMKVVNTYIGEVEIRALRA